MSMYKIEYGIPIPAKGSGRINAGRANGGKYPFKHMKPGASFYIPPGTKDAQHVQMAVLSAAAKFKKMRFTSRANKRNAVRVWREE